MRYGCTVAGRCRQVDLLPSRNAVHGTGRWSCCRARVPWRRRRRSQTVQLLPACTAVPRSARVLWQWRKPLIFHTCPLENQSWHLYIGLQRQVHTGRDCSGLGAFAVSQELPLSLFVWQAFLPKLFQFRPDLQRKPVAYLKGGDDPLWPDQHLCFTLFLPPPRTSKFNAPIHNKSHDVDWKTARIRVSFDT